MSFVPLPSILNENWYAMPPSRLMDQHLGLGMDMDDLLVPVPVAAGLRGMRCPARYYQPWRSAAKRGTGPSIIADKDKYQVNVDVQQFAPEEISVKVSGDNTITVEGQHEEKPDEHGFVSRHFVRKYVLPEGHDIKNIVSHLSSDGVLSITAPRVNEGGDGHRHIPIQQTGIPMKAVKDAKKPEAKAKI